MANSLLRHSKSNNNNKSSLSEMINKIRSSGASSSIFDQMYQSNPEFKKFADSMKGKTPEQAFSENGLDFNRFRNLKW